MIYIRVWHDCKVAFVGQDRRSTFKAHGENVAKLVGATSSEICSTEPQANVSPCDKSTHALTDATRQQYADDQNLECNKLNGRRCAVHHQPMIHDVRNDGGHGRRLKYIRR